MVEQWTSNPRFKGSNRAAMVTGREKCMKHLKRIKIAKDLFSRPVRNIIKLFWHNLHHYRRISLMILTEVTPRAA